MLRLRRPSSVLAACLLAGGPAVLAFFAGGFFDRPRLVAALVAWLLVALAAVLAERPLPLGWPGRLALVAFVLLAGWTALSLAWAPLRAPAMADVQRVVLYCGVLAAAAWLADGAAARAVEPLLALGAAVVIGAGMSERFLPSLFELDRSALAFGRLEQPLTYWNATGLLAAIGLVVCVRLAAGPTRARAMRAAAAAAAPLLGAGLMLTLSRGAFAAAAVGMLALLALAPERSQARSAALAIPSAGVAAALAAALPGVDTVDPERASASSGAILLAAVLLLGALAAGLQWRLCGRPGEAAAGARRVRIAAAVAVAAVLVATLAAVASGGGVQEEGTETRTAQRLGTFESPRLRYWEVAIGALAADPLRGAGSAGFRVEWAREGGEFGVARDAHSLYVETAGELGLVGVALLVAWLAGVGMSARRAFVSRAAAAAGPAAVVCTWAFHAGIDWVWEMPAVTLPALVCAGLLVALGDLEAFPAGQRGRSA